MPNNKYKKINEPFQRSMGSSRGPPLEIPCVKISKKTSSSRHAEINQSNNITLNRPDSSAETPQKFDSSESVTHSPRNKFEIEPQISTSPASEQVYFDVITPHHTPDSTSLHYPDTSAQTNITVTPTGVSAQKQTTVTPILVLVNFDASTPHPHPPDVCFLPPNLSPFSILVSEYFCRS